MSETKLVGTMFQYCQREGGGKAVVAGVFASDKVLTRMYDDSG